MSQITQPIVIASLMLLAVAFQAAATETNQPYRVILTRNAFGLKPPPPPPPIDSTEPGPPPNVKLTGIIGITQPKKAMFVVTPAGKSAPLYLTVNEGEFSEDSLLKVVGIDELAGSVKIVMNGATSILDFEKNGVKTALAPTPLPTPTVQPLPGGVQLGSAPGGQSTFQPIEFTAKPASPSAPGQPAAPASSLSTIPTRQLRAQPK